MHNVFINGTTIINIENFVDAHCEVNERSKELTLTIELKGGKKHTVVGDEANKLWALLLPDLDPPTSTPKKNASRRGAIPASPLQGIA